MSYSQVTPCWNCNKKEKCTDHVKINDAVQSIHSENLSTESGHMGSGSIVLNCTRIDAKDK